MGVRKSERCTTEFTDGLEPPRCRNRGIRLFDGDPVCQDCYESLEDGYQKFLIEEGLNPEEQGDDLYTWNYNINNSIIDKKKKELKNSKYFKPF